jgi:hypothetical protein
MSTAPEGCGLFPCFNPTSTMGMGSSRADAESDRRKPAVGFIKEYLTGATDQLLLDQWESPIFDNIGSPHPSMADLLGPYQSPFPAPRSSEEQLARDLGPTLLVGSAILTRRLPSLGRNLPTTRTLPALEISLSRHPQLAENIHHAQRAGHPSVLTYAGGDARAANARRAQATNGVPRIPGLTRDEYPFASTLEGGAGSWVGHVPGNQNSAQGGIIADFARRHGLQGGDLFEVKIVQ